MLCSGTRPNISYRTPLASMSETYRVLIVDDDDAQAEMMREFLHISGYANIDRAANIHDFWQLLKKGPYDIILLDYKLPDGTGLDVLEQMAARGHHIPVVMITGQGNERIAAQAIQRGATDYLLKSGDYLASLPALIRKTIRAHELKQSVQRSLEQIRYQALLLNNVRDAVVVWDMAERITFWNPAAAALFGWSADERLGRPVSQIYLHTFSPAITLPREESRGGSQPVVRKFINREGNTLWVSSRLAILRDEERGGRLIGYMDVSRDITRRVETEQALRDSEARYRAIVEDYQTELICRFKPNGSLTFVNEVYCRYFGKPREELLGMNFLYFIPESERPKIVQHLLSFSPEKTVARLEHQVKLPSKGLRWLQRTDRAILDDEGRIFEFQSMARDISEQKRMEAQIKAAQAHLVQAARMATIGEMASGVAHQIYNPLTTIIADAQILLRELPPEQPGRDSAEAIEQAGWRLQQAVQRLMEFSRPTSETLGAISINDTLRSAISLVNAHIDATGCRLEVDLAEDLPPVRGNPRQLESLWVNLLLLARDASANEHDQTIWVSSAPGSSETVIIEVRDNGQPIPKEQLGTIFEPNFVGPSSGRGTGMELSICREIVRQHGGQITADSGRDRDTIFRVALPVEV
jgi:two-component system cell cycle sensor histidine kinase/response regulator CckA